MAKLNFDSVKTVEQAERMIASSETFIHEKHAEIGRVYCLLHADSPEDAMKSAMNEIAQANDAIEGLNNRILALMGLAKCSACGAKVSAESFFCNKCGHRLQEPPAVTPAPAVKPAEEAVPVPEPAEPVAETAEPVITAVAAEDSTPAPAESAPIEAPAPAVPEDAPAAPVDPVPEQRPVEAAVCGQCGSPLKPAMRFCVRCGHPVKAQDAEYGAPRVKKPFVSDYDTEPAAAKVKTPFVSDYDTEPAAVKPKKAFVSDYASDYADAPAPVPAPAPAPVSASAPAPAPAPVDGANLCPRCGNSIKPGAKFCVRCGAKLAAQPQTEAPAGQRTCPKCGKVITNPNMKFCTGCGTKLV